MTARGRRPEERSAYLDEVCGEDAELRGELETLLHEHDRQVKEREAEAPPTAVTEIARDGLIGASLGRYKILRLVGRGGMGAVYEAEDPELRRKVALKVLPAEFAADPSRLERFQREARALAALDHPNIVSVHSIEEAGGVHFLTMGFIKGRTLDELIPEEGLRPERVLELAVPLVEALCAAHARGIVHRDLKPANIMVDAEGRLRILDFGLAKQEPQTGDLEVSQEQTLAMTQLGTVLGSYPYMSPEQAEGKVADARSDIFSFGVVLYRMVAGHRPFQGDTVAALVSSILKDTPAPLSEVASEVPDELESIVNRCLEKAPGNRYQTAVELREHLGSLRRGRQRSGGDSSPQWRRSALVAVLVLLVGVGGVTLWQQRGSPPEPGEAEVQRIGSLAVLPLRNRIGDPEQEYFVDGMTEALITDLSKIGALKVTSRSASMRYKGTDRPLPEIARELGVEAFVEGQVLRDGDQVGIRVQLIEAATESNLWAETYNRELTSILALQSEVAQAIARQIQVTLTPEEETLLAAERQVDPEAYEAYLKGLFHWNELTPADIDTAFQYFELAFEKDPEYAPAQAGIAMVWVGRQQMGLAPPHVAMPAAKAAVARALELDSTLADAHSVLALISAWGDWNWELAEAEFERTLELKPNDPQTLAYYSHVLSILGRPEEALARAEEALGLDPFNALYMALYGHVLSYSNRSEAAIDQFEAALKVVPGHPVALVGLWGALLDLGRYEDAFDAAKSRLAATGELELVEALDRGYAEGGYQPAMARAVEVLKARPRERFFPALLAVAICIDAGDSDCALDWMERGVEIRDPSLPYVAVGEWHGLDQEPRYRAVLKALNLSGDTEQAEAS